jgi:hypothetical protein
VSTLSLFVRALGINE